MSEFDARKPDRVVVAPDGVRIEIRQDTMSFWPRWCAYWTHGGERHGSTLGIGFPGPSGEDVTNAEVLAEYETWKAEVEARR